MDSWRLIALTLGILHEGGEESFSVSHVCAGQVSSNPIKKHRARKKKKILQDNQLMERVHIHKPPVTADAKT